MGLSGMLVPEEYGGLGGGAVEAAIAAEELGAAMIPSEFVGGVHGGGVVGVRAGVVAEGGVAAGGGGGESYGGGVAG